MLRSFVLVNPSTGKAEADNLLCLKQQKTWQQKKDKCQYNFPQKTKVQTLDNQKTVICYPRSRHSGPEPEGAAETPWSPLGGPICMFVNHLQTVRPLGAKEVRSVTSVLSSGPLPDTKIVLSK